MADVSLKIAVPVLLMASMPLGLALVQRIKTALPPVPVAASAPATAPVVRMPDDERAFLTAAVNGRQAFNAGRNELEKGSARPRRANAICNAISPGPVDSWVGKVAHLSTNGDGKGVLAVEIGPNVFVKTWNNALSDIGNGTLLEPGSPVYTQALSFRRGQRVQFSGTLFANKTDCVRESSLTLEGSLTKPEFIFRFSELSPL